MTYQDILVETPEPHVGLVRLNRPHVRNALSARLLDELTRALDAFEADPDCRVVVLTGDDRAFAAGADIQEFVGQSAVSMIAGHRPGAWDRIRRFPKPLVAAVSGYCLGGGWELAMLCDLVVASETARFGQPEIHLGIIPGAGGTQRLPRLIGKHRAMELILTGRQLTAQEAYTWGVVNRVAPAETYLQDALTLAREIAQKAPVAARLAKEAVLRSMDTPLDVGLDYERKLSALAFGTEDRQEGVRAFLEKRKPTFRGR
ncbi:MAG: enoyl-CoA hydratase-related protein [Armatimonadota bacterium]|nr:enoyl-CoA hydratase-related protein [Armatimonadota bacterium]MDR5675869.1 enoyl-CoA hydratase-related protein [Armatimonadota bacterium]MDR5690206.1 enoyl-CoA hydratase-related protein [Armatimonadota bacterium]MDR7386326.1 enoyl-CoA hydratase-related protein [Armatimonadota bacterium]MDR7388476.1 enoyl-CoA hydratase-related protein [Armatimonadota bacterium]